MRCSPCSQCPSHWPAPHRTRGGRGSLPESFPCNALRKCAAAARLPAAARPEAETAATIPACYYYGFRAHMVLKLKITPAIYLVGFMGCGKSSVGRALAEELGWSFIDLDEDIETCAGAPIAHIFDTEGEANFRALETEALEKRVQIARSGQQQVISLGGGAFTMEQNIELVLNHGVTVWLDAPFDVIERRIAQETHRPLARDPVRMKTLFDQRSGAYARADYRIETGEDGPAAIVSRILALPLFTP